MEGKGSSFRVSLPLEKDGVSLISDAPEKQVDQHVANFMEDYGTPSNQTACHLPAPVRNPFSLLFFQQDFKPVVLIIDDNRDMRDYIGRLLSHQFRVLFADDGLQALQIIKLVG